MFAYARDVDDSIVLAAGIPVEWFDGDDVDGADGGEGLAIRGLRTPHGELGYSLRRKGNTLGLEVADGIDVPAGGLEIGRDHLGTPVTNAHLVSRLRITKNKHNTHITNY